MSQPTQTYKRSLAGSVGAGLSSVFNAGGRTYYILEHKVSSQYHRAGEAQEIIVDQIEIGRDPKCQVQFDENFKTVSRRHAAIVRDGENWKLVQLSNTNQTFLNGRPVVKEWYLQNGDEIQLSVNGPKLGFIVPSGNKSKTGSIALSRRLSLFRQQALKPYKTAMTAMAVFIVLLIAGGVTYGVLDHKQDEKAMAELIDVIDDMEKKYAKYMEEQRAEWEAKFKKQQQENAKLREQIKQDISTRTNNKANIVECEPLVYYIQMSEMIITFGGNTQKVRGFVSGTGFLLNDGRFITARHVVKPWLYGLDEEFIRKLNAIVSSGGSIECNFVASSPTGKQFRFSSSQVRDNSSKDTRQTFDGLTYTIGADIYDYAYIRTSQTNGLPYDNNLSRTLPVQAKLTILGYPMGLGVNSSEDIHPLYSEATVAREGLQNGLILTTATTFEHGNSGGPVFATTTDGELIVVGVVSAIAGRSTGFVIPIASIQ